MVLCNHILPRDCRYSLPEKVAKFLGLTPEQIQDLPFGLWDASARNVAVLGIPLTVGYKSMDECYDVLKIVFLSVTLPRHVKCPGHVYKYKRSSTYGSRYLNNILSGMRADCMEAFPAFRLTFDKQRRSVVDAIGRSTTPLIPIRAVCGAGKSVGPLGLILWACAQLQDGKALACLTPNRNQRKQMLRTLRAHLPFEDVMSLGRREDGSTAEADDDFDSFVDKEVAQHFEEALTDMKRRRVALAKVVSTPDVETAEGKLWLADTAELQRLAFTHFRLREQYIRQLHGRVKISRLMVNCFLQTQSKAHSTQHVFETIRARAVLAEESRH